MRITLKLTSKERSRKKAKAVLTDTIGSIPTVAVNDSKIRTTLLEYLKNKSDNTY